MKYILIVFTAIVFTKPVLGQNTDSIGSKVSRNILRKLSDSLNLRQGQKDSIYLINMGLHYRKMSVWHQYSDIDSLTTKIQRIENTRDSLYHKVLTDEQFTIYRNKKRNLVNNN
jgi:hypothetical protein